MNKEITTNSIKYSPIALAIVLFFVLGLLAFQVRAEEGTTPEFNFREQMKENKDAQAELFEEQKEERREVFEQNRSEFEEMRAEGSSIDEMKELRTQTREETQAMLVEHRTERSEFHSEQKEMMQTMFEERKNVLKDRVEERKQEREEKMEERKAKFSAKRQEVLTQFSERIVERMNAAFERLEQIAGRIDERIEKMEANGVDLSDAKNTLGDVYVLLEGADEYVALVGDVSVDTITSDDPASQKDEIRAAVELAKDSIKEIHRGLSETVQLIKAGVPSSDGEDGEDGEDGSTVTTTESFSLTQTYNEGVHTFSGTVTTPTPCYTVEATALVAESYPEQITINVTTASDGSDMCTQVIDEKEFSLEATASEEANVVAVIVNGESYDWD